MQEITRGVDEGLVIGGTVQVNILEVQADCVRVAIIDPDASPTYREEVLYLFSNAENCASIFDEFDEAVGSGAYDDGCSFEDSRLIKMA